MTTQGFLGASGDGDIYGFDATYVNAAASVGATLETSGSDRQVGQQFSSPNYKVWEGFLAFDTSSISDSAVIDDAVLYVAGNGDQSAGNDFTIEARSVTWTPGGLTTADFVQQSDITTGHALLATFDTTPGWRTTYNKFISTLANFTVAINLTGNTEMFLVGSNTRVGSAPSADEYVTWVGASGALPPRLVVNLRDQNQSQTLEIVASSPMRW